MNNLISPTVRNLTTLAIEKGALGFFDERGKFVPQFMARSMRNYYQFASMPDNMDLFIFSDGVYVPAEATVRAYCEMALGAKYSSRYVTETIHYLVSCSFRNRIEPEARYINLANGVYDLDTGQLLPHNPEMLFFNKVPVAFNPGAKCPAIEKFLDEVAPESKDVLLEWVGYCLYREYLIHKALFLKGTGRNGKSTYLELLNAFLGRDNVANIEIQQFGENRFASSRLYARLANIAADIPARRIVETGRFKMLTGGDTIEAEKKFKDGFSFRSYAKLAFSGNQVPETDDESDAYFRRILLVTFSRTFQKDEGLKTRKLAELTTPEELSGLLNVAVVKLKEFLARGYFIGDQEIEVIRKEYLRASSSVAAFVQDCIDWTGLADDWIETQKLINDYQRYCRERKINPKTPDAFCKLFPRIANTDRVRGSDKGRPWGYSGIKFVPPVPPVTPFLDPIYPPARTRGLEKGVTPGTDKTYNTVKSVISDILKGQPKTLEEIIDLIKERFSMTDELATQQTREAITLIREEGLVVDKEGRMCLP